MAGTGAMRAARPPWLFLTLVTALGAALRFYDLGHAPFWLDENATFLSLQHLWDRGVDAPIFVQASNPLYYGLLWGWMQLVGDGAAALRSFSALAGTGCIALGAALANRLGGASAARVAAVLIALHPLHLHYSREARAYALWTLLLLLATAALWSACVRGGRSRWLLASLGWLAAFGAHVFTLFALPASVACVLWSSNPRDTLRGWLGFAGAVAAVCGLYGVLVLWPALEAGAGSWLGTSGWHPFATAVESLWALLPSGAYPGHLRPLSLMSERVVTWTPPAIALVAATLPLAIVPFALASLRGAPAGERDWRPLLVLALLPLGLLWGASWFQPVLLAGRYDLVAWPALSLWISLGVAALGRERATRAGLATFVLALCAAVPVGRVLSYEGGDRFDQRRALRLAALVENGDLVIAFSNDDDALAHDLHRAGFTGTLRPFPGWLARQIAFLDSPHDLSPERRRALARDAAALVRSVNETQARGAEVYWLGDALRLDGRAARAILPERLEEELRAAGLRRVSVDESLAIDRLDPR